MKTRFPVLLLPLIITSLATPALAETVVEGPVQAEVIRVVDGDTILVSAKPWPQQSIEVFVRLRGIDTPELKSRCETGRQAAEAARDALESMIADTSEIKLTHISADKYFGRIVADVALEDGTNPAAKLLAAGLGARYSGHGRKFDLCRDE
ncbi:thermonuclease family protein [Rhizobium oryzicola]|uniref:Thermonuclease family protein n=1 Tax=Rhizobium oryzicola TaxID=1232668 RepID=A0ABT8T289_9HYPH|nr:thermonuclease family protein [Rhizobium oryzicola]MDO1584746.1 thermonuclease family protein [Rhizobium oryzicola]